MHLPPWIVVLPPFITLLAAFLTKRVGSSLLLGIFSAALIMSKFSVFQAFFITTGRIWANTQIGELLTWQGTFNNLYMFGFLLLVGIIIAFMGHTGGAEAYGTLIKKRLTTAQSVESASIVLSMLLFLDDYLNCLTVGCVMRPLTDQFKIPRAKLAFLIDSLAAPFIILIPISSWVAVICNNLLKAGVDESPHQLVYADQFYLYLLTIPFLLYSLILLATVWFIVHANISFGLMKQHEDIAKETGNLFGGKQAQKTSSPSCIHEKQPSLIDFVLPIVSLVVCVIFGLLYQGGFMTGTATLVQALQNADSFPVLFFSGLISLVLSLVSGLARRRLSWKQTVSLSVEGIRLMLPSIIILLLAWTFSDLLKNNLHTGDYLAYLMVGTISITLMPVMLYITSALISTTIGSSWATMFIMIPLAVPLLVAYSNLPPPLTLAQLPILIPTLGAILSGAVTGDHLSPLASTTIMATSSSGAYLMDHIKTQFAYSWPVILATTLAFFLAGITTGWGYGISWGISLTTGLCVSFLLLWILHKRA